MVWLGAGATKNKKQHLAIKKKKQFRLAVRNEKNNKNKNGKIKRKSTWVAWVGNRHLKR